MTFVNPFLWDPHSHRVRRNLASASGCPPVHDRFSLRWSVAADRGIRHRHGGTGGHWCTAEGPAKTGVDERAVDIRPSEDLVPNRVARQVGQIDMLTVHSP